jgi:hypothetical protein
VWIPNPKHLLKLLRRLIFFSSFCLIADHINWLTCDISVSDLHVFVRMMIPPKFFLFECGFGDLGVLNSLQSLVH